MRVCVLYRLCCQWLLVVMMLLIVEAAPVFGAETKGAASGQSNFEARCARCHGATGKGNGFQALALFFMFKMPDLTDLAYMQARSDDALFRSIKQGSKGGMPAYKLKLSEPEIKDLVVYIRSFTRTSSR
ncbi:cytochrome C [Candidatus Methylomirabilis lanthanidiphila]|uniref:Cytochrome C n=1 Tax=Candidatus Methylomirabilis lanthanidiphila TaxID=2211376 RepID=A0A564ZMF4_9BACT|nr:cytochrome C [Candidatus Methylomirabilis lanthanidiphila]